MSGTTCCVFFNIMNDTTCSCSHFSDSHSFLTAGKQSEMSKRSQESSSPGSPMAKAQASGLVSRHGVSVGQDCSSIPKSLGSTRDSQVWTWEEKVQNPDGILSSMPRDTESMVQKILERSLREYMRKRHAKTRKTDSDTMKASRNYRWTPRKCTPQHGRDLWLHRCRQHCTWIQVTKRIWKYSRILNLRTLKVCSVLRQWWSKEIQKMRMYFPQMLRVHFRKNPYCSKSKQQNGRK